MANNQPSITGVRKGKNNSFRKMLTKIANQSLRVYPVPGLGIFLAKGFNPHQEGISITPTPRHANVLLVTSPLPETLFQHVAITYTQMPRPRLLVFVDMQSVEQLPSPDFILTAEKMNRLHHEVFFTSMWAENAAPFESALLHESDIQYTCPMHPEVQRDKPGKCPKCGMALVKKEKAEQEMDMPQNKSIHHHESTHDKNTGQHKEETKDKQGGDNDSKEEGKTIYTCAMHPEVQSDKPGNCPKCGMALVKKNDAEKKMDMKPKANEQQHQHGEKHDENSHSHAAEVKDETGVAEGNKNVFTCPMHPEVQSDTPGNCPKCGMMLVKKEDADHQMDINQKQGDHKQHHEHKKEGDSSNEGEHKGHGDMGFMSMVAMTKDMPRSEDGLAMEMNDVFFGPFHPGLPGGLIIKMKLDGDTVFKAGCENKPSHHLPENFDQLQQHFIKHYPLISPVYRLLLFKASTNTYDHDKVDEILILEKTRIQSHLNWLSIFSMTIGSRNIHYAASKLCYELQSGKGEKKNVLSLVHKIRKIPYLKTRLNDIGIIPNNLLKNVSGPLAKAAGIADDMRSSNPLYRKKNFRPIVLHENNSWGHLLVRLLEIEQSMKLIHEEDFNKNIIKILPAAVTDNTFSGDHKGEAFIEAPNGRLHLVLEIKEGKINNFELHTASAAHAKLIPHISKGKEFSDALTAIAGLDISPMEIADETQTSKGG